MGKAPPAKLSGTAKRLERFGVRRSWIPCILRLWGFLKMALALGFVGVVLWGSFNIIYKDGIERSHKIQEIRDRKLHEHELEVLHYKQQQEQHQQQARLFSSSSISPGPVLSDPLPSGRPSHKPIKQRGRPLPTEIPPQVVGP